MKKFFTFCAAMLVALAANATTVNINPGTATLQTAVAAAAAGDVIVLADGTYDEAGDYITLNKNIEIKAAEGAHPVVLVKTYVKIQGGSKIKIEGIKFDGAQQGTYSYFFRVYDNAANYLELEGCELCNNANMFIKVEADKHIDSIKINNCYFHDGTNNAIRCYKTSGATNTCDKLVITNSTFANFAVPDYGCIQVENVGNAVTADIKVIVDHCTFYNLTKPSNNTYGVIDDRKSTDNTISNCIFANPAELNGRYAHRASQLYGGTVSNCLVYNTPDHRTDDITVNNPVNLDPLFVDAANGDFTLGAGSPAIGAGTDGSNLGDPNWKERTVYFYNTLGWSSVYVNIYNGPYWDNTNGSGNYPGTSVVKANQQMTQVSGNYYKYTYTGGYNRVVSFTSASQPDYGNFYGIAGAVYRGDYCENATQDMFIPNTVSNETKNEVAYYNNGIWVPCSKDGYTFTYEDLNYKTLCLPFGGTLTGANAYTVTGVDEGAGTVTLSEPTTTLTAGVAYIIKPTALTVSVAFAGEPVTVGTLDYLRGNLNAADWKVDNSWWAYILLDNEFCLISSAATANVPQFKAILKANNTSLAPTLRIIENATDIKNIEGNEAAVKFLENGKLLIRKDGVVYDMTGCVVR